MLTKYRKSSTAWCVMLVVNLMFASLPSSGQIRRGNNGGTPAKPVPRQTEGRRQPPQSSANTTKPAERQMALQADAPSREMAAAYQSGRLPQPLAVPPGNRDEAAAVLAKQLAAKNEKSLPALLTALQLAGISVRASDGSILIEADKPGQGLTLPAWRVAATNKLYGDGFAMPLEDLSAALGKLPALGHAPISQTVIEGIRSNALGNHGPLRFWARFIVELGKQSEKPFDLLNPVPPQNIQLNAVQAILILTRLTADLLVIKPDSQSSQLRRAKDFGGVKDAAVFRRAGWSDNWTKFAKANYSFAPKDYAPPCTTDDTAALIMNTSAAASGFGFSQLMNYLSKQGLTGAGKYSELSGTANIILNVIKLIATYAALKVDIQMDGQQLVRTKTTAPGERRLLTAHAKMEIGKWQIVNCVRPALNIAGLDFSLPSDGDLGDVAVEWQLTEGGDSRGWIGTLEDFDKIMSGKASYGDGVVFFDAVAGANRSPAKQTTDAKGLSRINLVGAPQKEDLSKQKLTELFRQAKVKALITLTRINEKDRATLFSAMLAVAGMSASALTGDVKGAAVSLAFEMLGRSNSFFFGTYTIPVKDWEKCTGKWHGEITATIKQEKTKSEALPPSARNLSRATTTTENLKYVAQMELVDQGLRQTADLNFNYMKEDKTTDNWMDSCHSREPLTQFTRVLTSLRKRHAEGEIRADIAIIVNSKSNNRYSISVHLADLMTDVIDTDQTTYLYSPRCDNQNYPRDSASSSRGLIGSEDFSAEGEMQSPDKLTGTKTIVDARGRTLELKWDLYRC